MKFRFGLIALFSAAALITAACGDKGSSTNAQGEKVQTAGSSEKKIIENFYKSVEAGKNDDVIKAIAFSGNQNSDFTNKAQKLVAQEKTKIEAKGGIKSVDAAKAEGVTNNNETPFTVKITFGDGSTEEGTVNLVKDGSDWKISL